MNETTGVHEASAPPTIVGLAVRDLFGWLSYDIGESPAGPDEQLGSLLILYGENGSGKTTLLRLLYHLLSTEVRGGHKTAIARTPFREFTVRLSGETTISAIRAGDSLVGSFEVVISGPNDVERRFEFHATDELRVKAEDQKESLENFNEAVHRLGVSVYMLPDDRRTPGQESVKSGDINPALYVSKSLRRHLRELGSSDDVDALSLAVARLEAWIREQAFSSTSTGESNINEIYGDVVRRIATAPLGVESGSEETQDIAEHLVMLGQRNVGFVEYGFTTPLSVEPMVDLVREAHPDRRLTLASVLNPYLSGIRARLDALEDIREVVDRLVSSLNVFYENKTVSFDMRDGLEIVAANGVVLDPTALSSGEKQLLLLLANTVIARGSRTVVIIDEPEISLNVKWQRKLIPTLLDLVAGSSVQFVLATHSIELITPYQSSVKRLNAKS